MKSINDIWKILERIPDPEIPVISVVELGIIRALRYEGPKLIITITPTYSGCPAMSAISIDINNHMHENDIKDFQIETVYQPAWTTDWMSKEAKEKLRVYGIAPPNEQIKHKLNVLTGDHDEEVNCPHCGSNNTILTSQFGSTACKALYKCKECLEPFDYFKCI
jgi:ring-1,2-phenylacetyl-CoA epoxidase subunit PaaD